MQKIYQREAKDYLKLIGYRDGFERDNLKDLINQHYEMRQTLLAQTKELGTFKHLHMFAPKPVTKSASMQDPYGGSSSSQV